MADLHLCVLIQALSLTPVSFSLIAGAGANASIGGVVDVTNGNVADLYTHIAEVEVDSAYQVEPPARLPSAVSHIGDSCNSCPVASSMISLNDVITDIHNSAFHRYLCRVCEIPIYLGQSCSHGSVMCCTVSKSHAWESLHSLSIAS